MTDIFSALKTIWTNFSILGTGTDVLILIPIAILTLGTTLETKDKMTMATILYAGASTLGMITTTYGLIILIIMAFLTAVVNFE